MPPPGLAIVEELDKTLLVQLRDGRKIIGILRSFDQFANLVLEGKQRLGFWVSTCSAHFQWIVLLVLDRAARSACAEREGHTKLS